MIRLKVSLIMARTERFDRVAREGRIAELMQVNGHRLLV
jgi:hypothetical protein